VRLRPDHARDLLAGQLAEHPQEDNVLLVGLEASNEPSAALDTPRPERIGDRLPPLLWVGTLVEQAVMSDREGPDTQVPGAAAEARQVARDLHHHLAEQLLGPGSAAGSQVAEQGRRELEVDGPPGPTLALPSG